MLDYSEYTTGDPFMEISYNNLFESKGIPNILKEISKEVLSDLLKSDKKNPFNKIYYYEYDNFNTNISVYFNQRNIKEIYATSKFGIFDGSKLKESEINIFLDIPNYSKNDLERVITHELLHIYEIFNRYKNKSKKDLQWKLNNVLMNIRNKYKDKFITDFCYLIYLSTDQEINARVSETYSILIENKSKNKNFLLENLKNTSAWKYSVDMKEFNHKNYLIDYSELIMFLTELNRLMKEKFKYINFNIYKIPNSQKDCRDIIKAWESIFKKKSIKFQSKMIKIIDEVINDVIMIESAYIEYDINRNLSDRYVLKYNIFLERESKLKKLMR